MKPNAVEAHVENVPVSRESKTDLFEDEFLKPDDLVSVIRDVAQKRLDRILADIEELIRENKWEDAAALYWPVEEKLPDLIPFAVLGDAPHICCLQDKADRT